MPIIKKVWKLKPVILVFLFFIAGIPVYSRFYNIRQYSNEPNKFILVSEAREGFTEARLQAILECGLGRHQFCIRALGENLSDENLHIRKMSARNLGFIHSTDALVFLYDALEKEKDTEIIADIIWAIGYIGEKESVAKIESYLKEEKWQIRNAAVEAMGDIHADSQKATLEKMLESEKNFRVKISLLTSLIQLEHQNVKYRTMLILLVKSNAPEERYYAALSLEKLKLKEATIPLQDALQIEGEEAVRDRLRRALFIIRNTSESLMQ